MGLSEDDIRQWPRAGGWHLDPRSGHRVRTGEGLDLGDGVSLGEMSFRNGLKDKQKWGRFAPTKVLSRHE